jgi:hypothetical protein
LAQKLNFKAIAEGVETELQLFELQISGVDYIQGYYFYKPLSFDELVNTLTVKNRVFINDAEVYSALYVSESIQNRTNHEIETLVKNSRTFNSANGVTGCLLYREGYFLQFLEGRKEIIDGLLMRICNDKRHKNMQVILKGMVKKRLFSDWSMGHWNMDTFEQKFEFEEIREKSFNFKELSKDPQMCYAIFYSLSKSRE